TDRIFDVDVDLRSVEGGFPLLPLMRDAASLERRGERTLGMRPLLVSSEILLGRVAPPDGDVDPVRPGPAHPGGLEGEVEASDDLAPRRLRAEEGYGIAVSEPADAQEPVARPAELGAIDGPDLG